MNAGFETQSNVAISRKDYLQLQFDAILSHTIAGVGHPLLDDIVQLIILRIMNIKAKDYSGLHWSTFKKLLNIFRVVVFPIYPKRVLLDPTAI